MTFKKVLEKSNKNNVRKIVRIISFMTKEYK